MKCFEIQITPSIASENFTKKSQHLTHIIKLLLKAGTGRAGMTGSAGTGESGSISSGGSGVW